MPIHSYFQNMNILNRFKNLFSSVSDHNCCGAGHCGDIKSKKIHLTLSLSDQEVLKNIDSNIVVGKILSISPHSDPKITKVSVTQCDLGDGKETQILCGGINIAESQIVPIAKVGAKLSEDFEIGVRDIRGETSNGMICAQSELGLSAENEEKGSIWVLPSELKNKLGTPVKEL